MVTAPIWSWSKTISLSLSLSDELVMADWLKVYKPLNTFIALVGLEVWSNRDQISVVAPAGATLDAFNNWR